MPNCKILSLVFLFLPFASQDLHGLILPQHGSSPAFLQTDVPSSRRGWKTPDAPQYRVANLPKLDKVNPQEIPEAAPVPAPAIPAPIVEIYEPTAQPAVAFDSSNSIQVRQQDFHGQILPQHGSNPASLQADVQSSRRTPAAPQYRVANLSKLDKVNPQEIPEAASVSAPAIPPTIVETYEPTAQPAVAFVSSNSILVPQQDEQGEQEQPAEQADDENIVELKFQPIPEIGDDDDDKGELVKRQPEEIAGELFTRIRTERLLGGQPINWSLNDAIAAALHYSNRVSSLKIRAAEELQNVGIEFGAFDTRGFIEQRFRDSAEPVGQSFEAAAGVGVINGNDFNIRSGLRKQLRSGGDFEIGNSIQYRDNDSGILVPDDQVFNRFGARLNKEILRGAGRSIALNQVLVARHNADAQGAASRAEIANHLTEVMNAYWDIFAARGAVLAAKENRDLATEVLLELESREEIDADENLLAQTRATISLRELQVTDSINQLKRAQIGMVSLVNAPELLANKQRIEILPQVEVNLDPVEIDTDSRINTAVQRRPEIADAISQLRSAQTINHLALNQLLPQLTLALEASLNGLDGDNDFGGAFGNQFDNRVTYGVGFDFEVPIGNRQARFGRRRTQLSVARFEQQWLQLIERVKAEVLVNAEDFDASQKRLQSQASVLKFALEELYFLKARKIVAPREESNPSFALTQILAAQDRQGAAKAGYIESVAEKHRAIFELNRATGILVNEDVLPADQAVGAPGFFAVYHQLIEEQPCLNCVSSKAQNEVYQRSGYSRFDGRR